MNAQTLPLPNPGDWTTVPGAAQILGVDVSAVRRMIDAGVLTSYEFPGAGTRRFLWVPEVRELAAARSRVRPTTRCA